MEHTAPVNPAPITSQQSPNGGYLTRNERRREARIARLARVRLAVYQRSDFRCCHCQVEFPPPEGYDGRSALWRYVPNRRPGRRPVMHTLDLDHIIPRDRGGKFHLDNLQALCTRCNNRKGVH
jgi:5-methylcytosine-specific restriction endonuclease McrA